MGFQLQQKSMILNDFERQFTALSLLLRLLWVVTKWLRLELRDFNTIKYRYHYTTAIRIISFTTKFKGIPFEFQAWFRI